MLHRTISPFIMYDNYILSDTFLAIFDEFWVYSKSPHKRTTIFRSQAGKGYLTRHFAQTLARGGGYVIKL